MLIQDLVNKKLINPPSWLATNTMYMCISGSISYGISDDNSDWDIKGFFIPPKRELFPYQNLIYLYDDPPKVVENYLNHGIIDPSALNGKGRTYDIDLKNIVKFFRLLVDSNPNMIDILFVPDNCIIHRTKIFNMVREKRFMFLSKEAWPTYKGYAYSQSHKSATKNPKENSKRRELREKYGMDTKFLYNIVRLLSQIEYVLMFQDLDLQEKGRREHMKAIRRGEVSEKDIRDWISSKEKDLEKLFLTSKLPEKIDKNAVRSLLLQCLEEHYGSLKEMNNDQNWSIRALQEIQEVIQKNSQSIFLS